MPKKQNIVEYVYNPKLNAPRQWGWDEDGNLLTTCPQCGKWQMLHHKLNGGHSIDHDGEVLQSIICPYKECDFHKRGKLKDWKTF
jgi:hypothetical protein